MTFNFWGSLAMQFVLSTKSLAEQQLGPWRYCSWRSRLAWSSSYWSGWRS